LPHQAVSKGKRGDTKWRIMFHASAHERGAPSVNDTLEMGTNLLPEIFATLLPFRVNQVAIVEDIQQVCLQLCLDERDRNLTRSFCYRVTRDYGGNCNTTNEVICYRFTRLPFGLTCSPFLLSASLRELANVHRDNFSMAAALVDSIHLWTILQQVRRTATVPLPFITNSPYLCGKLVSRWENGPPTHNP
jgi:hypothetical protein